MKIFLRSQLFDACNGLMAITLATAPLLHTFSPCGIAGWQLELHTAARPAIMGILGACASVQLLMGGWLGGLEYAAWGTWRVLRRLLSSAPHTLQQPLVPAQR